MKTNKTKSAMTALVIAAMLCTAAMPVKAADSQWVKTDGTWSYVKEDGSKATGWIKDGGCWYAFDADGAMRTGWIASNEHWYFMGESGVMQSDAWVEDNGAKYYIKGTGVMAKDYVKDGYELTSDGKAIPLGESGSVVVTDPADLEGKVIEGNLYVDITTAKELELKGVTVKGKLVVLGDNETAGKVTLTDSKVETINTQTRNAEVVLSGKTEVKNVVIEETAKVTPDKNYKGEVENIEVQSTTKGEVVIDVPAENVSTRTYATVDVKAPVGNLEVKTDTQVKVNADVKNVTVTETAKDTTVEVSKGNTVGTITADAPVKIDGKGTVDKVEANVDGVEAGKDTTIKDVETGKDVTEAPDVNKPSTGGGSSGGSGGDSTPSFTGIYAETGDKLIEALGKATEGQTIRLTDNMSVANADMNTAWNNAISNSIIIDLNGKTLTLTDTYAISYVTKELTFKNGKIQAMDMNNGLSAVFNPQKDAKITLEGVELTTNGAALYPQGSAAEVNVLKKSVIKAGTYAVATNAGEDENYGVNIRIDDSTLETYGYTKNAEGMPTDSDDATILINLTATLNISNSKLKGNRQTLVVRAGTANVTNTEIEYTNKFNNDKTYLTGNWDSGNEIPCSPIVVGSRNDASVYKDNASLTLNGVTIVGKHTATINDELTDIEIYMYGRETYSATLNVEDEGHSYKVVRGEKQYTTVTGLPTPDEQPVPTPAPTPELSEVELKEKPDENNQTGSTGDESEKNDLPENNTSGQEKEE